MIVDFIMNQLLLFYITNLYDFFSIGSQSLQGLTCKKSKHSYTETEGVTSNAAMIDFVEHYTYT